MNSYCSKAGLCLKLINYIHRYVDCFFDRIKHTESLVNRNINILKKKKDVQIGDSRMFQDDRTIVGSTMIA